MQPSRDPIRFQYRDPQGVSHWSPSYPTIEEAKIAGSLLVAAGNVLEGTFRSGGRARTEGTFCQYGMPWQAKRLGR